MCVRWSLHVCEGDGAYMCVRVEVEGLTCVRMEVRGAYMCEDGGV